MTSFSHAHFWCVEQVGNRWRVGDTADDFVHSFEGPDAQDRARRKAADHNREVFNSLMQCGRLPVGLQLLDD